MIAVTVIAVTGTYLLVMRPSGVVSKKLMGACSTAERSSRKSSWPASHARTRM